ncbi:hypothetical protein HPB47_018458 [Ixodes persulcatus]|uniref:Uncharacterized protein n=1 Tax=Ixodes persulcatus TaxID=34615 RepID=A0AC60QMM6_IXOPE|nr:hypothetical protein HPB47_018458 [Ixodes persulcatus]
MLILLSRTWLRTITCSPKRPSVQWTSESSDAAKRQYNGYFGCSWCYHPGLNVEGTIKYCLSEPFPDRTDEEAVHDMRAACHEKRPHANRSRADDLGQGPSEHRCACWAKWEAGMGDLSRASFWRVLRKLGFHYVRCSRQSMLLERVDLVAWRVRVIAMDNASYHSVKLHAFLTSLARKEELQSWLTTHAA